MGLLLVPSSCAVELMQFSVGPTEMQEFAHQVPSGQNLLFCGEQWGFLWDPRDYFLCSDSMRGGIRVGSSSALAGLEQGCIPERQGL